MAAGDTFRAAASDQLEIWAERTGCEIVVAEKEKAKASSGRLQFSKVLKLVISVLNIDVHNNSKSLIYVLNSSFTGC